MKHNIIKYFLLLTCLFFIQAKVFSQADEWIVPDNKKDVVSPFKFTDETRKAGGDIFDKNCKSCHGEPTKGNYAKLQPPPGDLHQKAIKIKQTVKCSIELLKDMD